MENEISAKRNLVLALVIVTILIFIGLVWLASAFFPWGASGTSNPTQPVSERLVEKNCTYPIAYWRQHPEMVPGRIVVGDSEYLAEEIQALLSIENGDLVAELQAQLVGAYLNIQSGAAAELIEATIFQAYGWVVEHPQGTPVAESERAVGVSLFNVLEAYNLGLAGVAACPDASVPTQASSLTSTGTPSAAFTATKTLTPTRTSTSTVRASASPTVRLATPRRTSSPTASREPTSEPVNTPVPTTQAAPATSTRTPFVPAPTQTATLFLTPPSPPPPTPTTPPPPPTLNPP